MDKVHIRDLTLRVIVGIYPEEKREKQDITINISMDANLAKASASDDIADTVDYKAIKKKIISKLETTSFNLIERVAECVAEICLADSMVERVVVTVDKPGALRFARSAAVTIERYKR